MKVRLGHSIEIRTGTNHNPEEVNLSGLDSSSAHVIQAFWNRQSGERFVFDQTSGSLQTREWHHFRHDTRRIRNCIDSALGELNLALKRLKESNDPSFENAKKFVAEFVGERLDRLPEKLFNLHTLCHEKFPFIQEALAPRHIVLNFQTDSGSKIGSELLRFSDVGRPEALNPLEENQQELTRCAGKIHQFTLANETLNHNLKVLFNVEEGTKLSIDSQGRLKKRGSGCFDRIKQWSWLLIDRSGKLDRIQSAIANVLSGIEQTLQSDESFENQLFTSILLNRRMVHLPTKMFSRQAVYSRPKLARLTALRRYASQQIDIVTAKEQLRDAMLVNTNNPISESKRLLRQALLTYMKQEALRAAANGVEMPLVGSAGSGSCRRLRGMMREPGESEEVTLFAAKPESENPFSKEHPSFTRRVVNTFVQPPQSLYQHSEMIAENAMGILSEGMFEQGLVPLTTDALLVNQNFYGTDQKKCTLQVWMHEAMTLHEFLGEFHLKLQLPPFNELFLKSKLASNERAQQLPKEFFRQMLHLDFLAGNIDRHFENALVIPIQDSPERVLVRRMLGLDGPPLGEGEVDQLLDGFFVNGIHQLIMTEMLPSFMVGERRYAFAAIDGGNSFVSSHPKTFRETKFSNLVFRMLPGFENERFSQVEKNRHTPESFAESFKKIAEYSIRNWCNFSKEKFEELKLTSAYQEFIAEIQVGGFNRLRLKKLPLIKAIMELKEFSGQQLVVRRKRIEMQALLLQSADILIGQIGTASDRFRVIATMMDRNCTIAELAEIRTRGEIARILGVPRKQLSEMNVASLETYRAHIEETHDYPLYGSSNN